LSKKTFEAVKKVNGELVVQLKRNQKFLCHKIEQIIRRNIATDSFQEVEKNRNRIETRVVDVFKLDKQLLKYSDGWDEYLNATIRVHRTFEVYDTAKKEWKISKETSIYVASMMTTAPQFAHIIRNHWSTENSNHYVKDVSMNEDNSRIRSSPGIFAKLRSFALNAMRANNVKNIRAELYTNCCDINNLSKYQYII